MSLTKEQIAAHVEELRLQGQACDGLTVGVVAALTFIITKAAGMAPADLAGLPDQSLWQAACKAHHKRPDLVHHLPDTIPLSRGEFHAIRWGLQKTTDTLPTGRGIFEITNATHPEHGNLMSKTLQIIAYAKRPTDSHPHLSGEGVPLEIWQISGKKSASDGQEKSTCRVTAASA